MKLTPASQALTALLDVRLPIVQAPMAGTSTPRMAAAVSNAGGLGSLGVGAMTADAAEAAIREFRQLSGQPLNVNVFCHLPAQRDAGRESRWLARLAPHFETFGACPPVGLDEIYPSFRHDARMLELLLDLRPEVVSFHFGLPSAEAVAALKDVGTTLLATATSPVEARQLRQAGVDAIVAQGIEAGGHRGVFDPQARDEAYSTATLTQLLLRECGLPVIAAGGLMTGLDIANALLAGAAAAQVGTAFVACHESAADDGYRQALIGSAARGTVMTRVISGRPARCLANRFTQAGRDVADDDIPDYPVAYDAGKALNSAARAAGEPGFGAQWAGQGAPRVRPMSTGALMAVLAREMDEAMTDAGGSSP